jgi:hypothetical protein
MSSWGAPTARVTAAVVAASRARECSLAHAANAAQGPKDGKGVGRLSCVHDCGCVKMPKSSRTSLPRAARMFVPASALVVVAMVSEVFGVPLRWNRNCVLISLIDLQS